MPDAVYPECISAISAAEKTADCGEGVVLRLFRWLSARDIPPSLDLRRLGWEVAGPDTARDRTLRSPMLAVASGGYLSGLNEIGEWRFAPLRRLMLLIGVDDFDARARLLRLGLGDVTGSGTSLSEVEARMMRIAAQAALLPRARQLGQLRLDLFERDGYAGERRLGLHPREFALLWRLSDTPGAAVSKKALLRDVWRMAFVPETNSLAVHIYRLRAKLAAAGLDWMVQTTLGGGYLLETAANGPGDSRRDFREPDPAMDSDDEIVLQRSAIQGLIKESQP